MDTSSFTIQFLSIKRKRVLDFFDNLLKDNIIDHFFIRKVQIVDYKVILSNPYYAYFVSSVTQSKNVNLIFKKTESFQPYAYCQCAEVIDHQNHFLTSEFVI